MGKPVRTCSSPNCTRITVPEATVLPKVFRPIFASKAALTLSGIPPGKVGKAFSVTSPAISQCPTDVSFPFDNEAALPQAPNGFSTTFTPPIGIIFPSPKDSMVGTDKPTASPIWPSVLAPRSP